MTVTYEKGILPRRGQNITLVCRIDCSEDLTEDLRYGNAPGFALAKNMIQKLNGIFWIRPLEQRSDRPNL